MSKPSRNAGMLATVPPSFPDLIVWIDECSWDLPVCLKEDFEVTESQHRRWLVRLAAGGGLALALWIVAAVLDQPVYAGNCIWNGSVDSNWLDPANWSGACNVPLGVPGPLDDVQIPSEGVVHEPIIDDIEGGVTVNSLWIQGGRILSASGQIQVISSFGNQGTLDVGSNTLDITGPTFSNSGLIIGDGTIRTYGPLSLWAGEVFSPTLELASGITKVNGVFSGPLVVDTAAILDLICSYPPGVVFRNDMLVNGTITGDCTLSFFGSNITNNGIIRPHWFIFDTEIHNLSGAGAWRGVEVSARHSSTLQLANDVTIEAERLYVDPTSSLYPMSHTLTLSGTLTFDHRGFIDSNGLVRTQGNVQVLQSTPMFGSSFETPILAAAGTTSACGEFHGPIEVSTEATLTNSCGSLLVAYDDVTVHGVLAGDGLVYFEGETFTNQGVVSIRYVGFQRSGTQSIGGTGQWTGQEVRIDAGSTTSLANDVLLETQYVNVVNGAELDLAGHILTLSGPLSFDHRGFTGSNGVVLTQGTVSIAQLIGTFRPSLQVVSGTTTAYGTFYGAITIAGGATLQVSGGAATTLTTHSNVTVSGSLAGDGIMYFQGETFTNQGTVSIRYVGFQRSGTQSIGGAGQWAGQEVRIHPESTTSLANDVVLGPQHVTVEYGAELGLSGYALTLSGPLAFDHRGFTGSNGTVRTQGEVSINQSGTFSAGLEISSGTTTLIGGSHTFSGPIEVRADAALVLSTFSSALAAYGDVSVLGSLAGDGSLHFLGETFANEGSVSASYVLFSGANLANNGIISAPLMDFDDVHTITGMGRFFNNTARIEAGATVMLGSNHQMSNLIVNGSLATPAIRLDVSGDFTNNGTYTHANGTLRFDGGAVQNLVLNVPTTFYNLDVASGTTLVETVAANNANVAGTLTNDGVIRKSRSVSGPSAFSLGLTGVTVDVTSPGNLSEVQVDRIDQNHPNANVLTATGRYWAITPTGAGYAVDLTLLRPSSVPANALVCRNETSEWDCAYSASTATTVTRAGVTELSDWAVGMGADATTVQDVAGRWGTAAGGPGFDPLLDMDRNGVIDIRDVMLVTSLWNAGG